MFGPNLPAGHYAGVAAPAMQEFPAGQRDPVIPSIGSGLYEAPLQINPASQSGSVTAVVNPFFEQYLPYGQSVHWLESSRPMAVP